MHKWQHDLMDSVKGVKYGQMSAYAARQDSKGLAELDRAFIRAKAQSEQVLLRQLEHTKLRDDGWLPVECSEYFHKNWSQCHAQCKEIFGDNYIWTGEIFWFRTEEDIVIFKLTFGA